MISPTHQFHAQITEGLLWKRLRQDISSLLLGIYVLDDNLPIIYKSPEMMVFNSNVLGPGGELGALSNFYAALIVLPDCAPKNWLFALNAKKLRNLLHEIEKWNDTTRLRVISV